MDIEQLEVRGKTKLYCPYILNELRHLNKINHVSMRRSLYGWVNALTYVQSEVSRSHIPRNPQGVRFPFLPLENHSCLRDRAWTRKEDQGELFWPSWRFPIYTQTQNAVSLSIFCPPLLSSPKEATNYLSKYIQG